MALSLPFRRGQLQPRSWSCSTVLLGHASHVPPFPRPGVYRPATADG